MDQPIQHVGIHKRSNRFHQITGETVARGRVHMHHAKAGTKAEPADDCENAGWIYATHPEELALVDALPKS
jgi:hypothetical protein